MIPVVYENLCPVCGGDLKDKEILEKKCANQNLPFSFVYRTKEEKEIEELFEKIIGKPRELQRFWIKRITSGESFAAVAPTGIGKTAFGLAVSLFFSLKDKRSYILVPTTILAKQCLSNIERYCKAINKSVGINSEGDVKVAFYYGRMKKAEKEKFLKMVKENNFDILITTTQFLPKNFDTLKGKVFDFVFVDDVDSILKSSRNVDRVLYLLGFRKINEKWVPGKRNGILMVSTATAKKGRATMLFRELLNFDVGSSFFTIRNIYDVFVGKESTKRIKELMQKMGKGGILYARTSEEAERYYNSLKKDFKIGIAVSKKRNEYEKFEKGEVDFLIGTAAYYGSLIRGLDLPEKIRYVIFIGLPAMRIDYENITPTLLKILALSFRRNNKVKEYLPILPNLDKEPKKFEALKRLIKEVCKKEKSEDLVITRDEVIFPDIRTYLQGSGRSSRLTEKGLTTGASFIFENNKDLVEAFKRRASYYDIEIVDIEDIDLDKIKKEIDKSRVSGKYKDMIKPALFIVESPTKARLISRFFGRPSVKLYGNLVTYEIPTDKYILIVTACLGHIVDLTTGRGFHGVEITRNNFVPIYSSIRKCKDCGYQYTQEGPCPKCGSKDVLDSKNRIEDLRKLASKVSLVIVGTDPDSEGEKIAWDLQNFLSPLTDVKRAEFHEVTSRAIKNALSSLREINVNKVKAQIVRRIEDRWIGFVLSQKLWKAFKRTNLSAGRVQTPVLGWIIEQAEKYKRKKKISVLPDLGLVIERGVGDVANVEIKLVSKKEEDRVPLPPYTTDELLKDASMILKLSSSETMKLAQNLFENGLITYHRTDSNRVSDLGLKIAEEYLGEDFYGRRWGLKDKTAEGAHECIRPTRPWDRYMLQRMIYEKVISPETLGRKHLALYDLIFRRFMASQCKGFHIVNKVYKIKVNDSELLEERITKAWGRAFELYKSVKVEKELPLGRFKTRVEVKFVPEAYPYTQADLVRLMKEKGLGRPSTYATIIEKLFIRGYISERGRFIYPTHLGRKVNSFLNQRYGEFVSEERTRVLNEKIDKVEVGSKDYFEVLRELYSEIKRV